MIKIKNILTLLVLTLAVLFVSGCINSEEETQIDKYNRLLAEYSAQHKPIKEMTTFIGTEGEIHGSFLLIGGSIYGTIDTQHYITLIYQVNINNETFHKSATIPLEDVDFITIGKNESSYLTIREHNVDDWFGTYQQMMVHHILINGNLQV